MVGVKHRDTSMRLRKVFIEIDGIKKKIDFLSIKNGDDFLLVPAKDDPFLHNDGEWFVALSDAFLNENIPIVEVKKGDT